MKLINGGGMDSFKKGTWSPEEDQKLSAYIKRYGIWNWSLMPKAAGLSRSGKSCRLRWMNYLKPSLKRECYSSEEIQKIIELHKSLGNKWSKIAEMLPGRTDNGIKNFWNTHLRSCCSSKSNKIKQPKLERAVRKHSSPPFNCAMENVPKESKSTASESSLIGFPTQSVSSSEEIISNITFDSFNDVNSQNMESFEEHVEWGFQENQSFTNVSEFIFDSFNYHDLNRFWLNDFVETQEVGYDLW